jgi:hypothetical protein
MIAAAMLTAAAAVFVACGSGPSPAPAPRATGGAPSTLGTGGARCADEVTDAIRQHVLAADRCFTGAVYARNGRLEAESAAWAWCCGVTVCDGLAAAAVDNANAAAEAALADVPLPSCPLGALSIDGDFGAEAVNLMNAIEGCCGVGTDVWTDCGLVRRYPGAVLRLDEDGRVVELGVRTEPSESCTCEPEASPELDGGAGDAGPSNSDQVACISRALSGLVFPCHAGMRLFGMAWPAIID